jgi:hypothetical protein
MRLLCLLFVLGFGGPAFATESYAECVCDPSDTDDVSTRSILSAFGANADVGDTLDIMNVETLEYTKWRFERVGNTYRWAAFENGYGQVAGAGGDRNPNWTGGNGGTSGPSGPSATLVIGIVEIGPITSPP